MYNLNGEQVDNNNANAFNSPNTDAAQNTYNAMPNVPPVTPDAAPTGSNVPPTGSYIPPTGSNVPPTGSYIPPTGSNMPPTGPAYPNNFNEQPQKSGVLGILGLIFAVVALPAGWFIPILGLALGIAAFVLSIIGCGKKRASRGVAIAGIVVSVIALIFTIVIWISRTASLLYEMKNGNSAIEDILENSGLDDNTDDYDDSSNDYSDYEDGVIADIDDVILFQDAGVTVTATELYYETYGDDIYPSVKVLIENDSASDISLSIDYCAVNGISTNAFISDSVTAGKKANSTIDLDSTDFANAGFTTIDDLQLQMHVYDPESYDALSTDTSIHHVTFADSYKSFQDKFTAGELDYAKNATLLTTDSGISIYYVGTTDVYDDGIVDFMFYLYNDSDTNLYLEASDLSVNDFMQSDYSMKTTASKTGCFITIECDDDSTPEESITNAAVSFSGYDDSYNTTFDTGSITFIQK